MTVRHGDYTIDPETGCWLWQRGINLSGYGVCYRDQSTQLAHRVYWQAMRGPIPDGMVIDHLCSVRSCVNPDHMETVSRTENIRRSPHCKLTHDQVREIKSLVGVIGYRRIAARYNVSPTTIRHIAKGVTWTDV